MQQNYIIQFDIETHTYTELKVDDFFLSHENPHLIYWIHCDINDTLAIQEIAKKIQLPLDVLSLIENKESVPKLIENNDAVTVILKCYSVGTPVSETLPRYTKLFLYLTKNYCLTVSKTGLPAIKEFQTTFHKYLNFAKTPCFILFLILDNVINDYSKLLLDYEYMADKIDLKARVTESKGYSRVINIKKQVMHIQHHVSTIRDILMRLSGKMVAVISEPCRVSLLNLLDHTKIIYIEAEAVREILKNTLDQIDNALMQRLNKTMKVLTAFNAIFLPISLIASIYGMNFRWMPELEWKYGYLWALSLMLFTGLFLFFLFKIKKWW